MDTYKVTLLTPCYNMEKYISHFLESILIQNYRNIELILVNDGSTDNTLKIIHDYLPRLERQCDSVKIINKPNGGQASAIATGLLEVTGDLLIWPDSDDFLLKGSIERRVKYMQEHPDCMLLRCNGYKYLEGNYADTIGVISKLNRNSSLHDFVEFKIPWVPGCYMVRVRALDEMNPDRFIFDSKCGQDIQLLLPILAKYECVYLDEYLFGYLVRVDSHSHSINNFEKQMLVLDLYEECVFETLAHVAVDSSKYIEANSRFILQRKYEVSWNYNNRDDMMKYRQLMSQKGLFGLKAQIMWFFRCNSFSKSVIRLVDALIRRGIKIEGKEKHI